MKPFTESARLFWKDAHEWIFKGDARDMYELPNECVQMVCTSPPYWGLRKYSGNQDLIWGDNHCGHRWINREYLMHSGRGDAQKSGKYSTQEPIPDMPMADNFCSLCGAWKGAFGLEPTPEMYVQHTIEILREIRRVLRKDGVVFWNIGDSYASSPPGNKSDWSSSGLHGAKTSQKYQETLTNTQSRQQQGRIIPPGLKPKDLCLIPFRIAIAAQEDGWWVRSVIIWSKPNPMPESVTDRPTESHEYLLMLTKSGTTQFWAHRDGNREAPNPDYRWVNNETHEETDIIPEGWTPKNKMGWSRINLWRGHDYYWDADAVREPQSPTTHSKGSSPRTTDRFAEKSDGAHKDWHEYTPDTWLEAGRNLRSVWEFNEGDEQGDNFYKVLQGCPIHSPLLRPEIVKILQDGEPQDCLLTHTLDKYGCLVPVLSSSLLSKLSHTSEDVHLSKLGFHFHESVYGQIVESIGDNRKSALCCPADGHKPYLQKPYHTKHTETGDELLVCSSDYSHQSDELTATLHNKEIRKTVSLIATNGSVFLQIPGHTVRTLQSLGCICSYNYYTTSHFPLQDVWKFGTQPFAATHFAVFPEKLPELCIKAATPEVGCCSKCGKPWVRIVERQAIDTRPGRNTGTGKSGNDNDPNQALHQSDLSKYRQQIGYETLGWQPTCNCNADKEPSIVLDPFMGTGTTLWVAKKLGRKAVGYDISEEYCQLAVERNRQMVMEM